MKINEQVVLHLNSPLHSETVPIWTCSDKETCIIEVASDGKSAKVTAVGFGNATISVATNCDNGSGVRQNMTSFDIIVDGSDTLPPVIEDPFIKKQEEQPTSSYWKDGE